MQVLEKILEEIEEATFQEDAPIYIGDMEVDGYVRISRVKEIIRSHMDDYKTFEFDFTGVKSFDCPCGRHYVNASSDGWIPCSERLPEDGEEMMLVQVSGRPTKNIWLDNAFEFAVYSEKDGWMVDNYPEWEKPDVIAWQPLPEPYKPKKTTVTGMEHIMSRFTEVK